MTQSVREKADVIATNRYICVTLMETLARWVPTTPELEAKALFGRHVWELAQHADAFGHRTAELRGALHQSRGPVPRYLQVLEAVAAAAGTRERLSAFYDAIVPDIERRYSAHLGTLDPLMDEPTIRILERVLGDLPRLRRDRDALVRERPDLVTTAGDAASVARAAAACADCVDYRPAVAGETA